jgi:hypothetical protein
LSKIYGYTLKRLLSGRPKIIKLFTSVIYEFS